MNCGPSESTPQQERRRPFICPCGKGYLSYPALFTHIKQKHEGKPPGKVIRPKSQNKRGRPRKMQLNDPAGEPGSERTEFRSFACRLLFGNVDEEKDLGYLMSQVESAKQRYRASLDFIPPITPSHLALLCPPAPAFPAGASHERLREELREMVGGTRAGRWAGAAELEEVISLNVPYLLGLEEERRSSRRPLGCELWEMELRTALLEFLDDLRHSFSRAEFRNVQLLVSLLLYFLAREVGEAAPTTANYAQHLNTFARGFLVPLARLPPYSRVFALQGDRPAKILVLLHRWMAAEGLSDYVVELAEGSKDAEASDPSE